MKRLKHIIFFVFSLFFLQTSFAQTYFHPGSTALVSADDLNVRALPSISAEVSASISFGQEVLITANTDSFFTSNGRTYPFVEIMYQSNGLEARGYVWAGLLTQAYTYQGNALYLLKHRKGGDSEKGAFTLFKQEEGEKKILTELTDLPIELEFLGEIRLEAKPISGLENTNMMVSATFIHEACCSSIDEYVMLEMKKAPMVVLPPVENTHCDGYQPRQAYHFPDEPLGKQSKIILAETGYDQEGNVAYVEMLDSFDWNGRDISVYRK